jgi:hypothetical protein
MAEEKKSGTGAKAGLKYLLGVVLVALGAGALIKFWPEVLMLIQACIGPFLLLAGVITIAIAKE